MLIDFGLVAHIQQLSMDNLKIAIVNLIANDYDALFDSLVSLEMLPIDADRSAVLPPLRRVLLTGMRTGSDLQRRAKNFGMISDDLGTIFYELPFQVPAYFALITRAIVVLEGIALVGSPDFDIFWAAFPFVLSRASSILGPIRTAQIIAGAAMAAQQLSVEDPTCDIASAAVASATLKGSNNFV